MQEVQKEWITCNADRDRRLETEKRLTLMSSK